MYKKKINSIAKYTIINNSSSLGVFALINTDINFGGNITFSATNIYATVSEGMINEGAISNTVRCQKLLMDLHNKYKQGNK